MKENIFNNISENFFNNSKYLYKSIQLSYIRFVGIDALMIVSSYDQLNFKNLKDFKEKVNYSNYNHYYTKFVLREKNNTSTSFDLDKKIFKKINILYMFLVLLHFYITQDLNYFYFYH